MTVQDLCNENLRFQLRQISMSEDEIDKVIEMINLTPFTLPFDLDELVEAQKKCDNMNR